MSETTTETTELALFPKLNLPTVTGITEQMNKSFGTMYTRIEAGIAELPTDMSIKANREKVASFAYSISRTKTGLDEAAAGVSGDAKQIVDAVNAERRQLKNTLDILRDKAREKLTAWEVAEKARYDKVLETVERFRSVAHDHAGEDSSSLAMVLDNLRRWKFSEEVYGDHVEWVRETHAEAVTTIEAMHEKQAKHEAEQIELQQLRREKAEREAAEAARIADEKRKADEAAEAAAEEERKAKAVERELAEARRIAEETRLQVEKEAAEMIEREKEAKEQAERDRQEAEERHAKAIADAEAARIRDAEEAKKREEEAAERARQQERERIRQEKDEAERQRLAQEKADQERAADLAHRKKVNSAATAAIMKAAGVSEKDAQAIVIAIYKGQIPNVTISY